MKLSTPMKRLLLDLPLSLTSALTTARWRLYVPLSIKSLVDIDKSEARVWSTMWGVTCAAVKLTEAGIALVGQLESDVSLWHPTATLHARERALGKRAFCACGSCMVAWRMRPVAA